MIERITTIAPAITRNRQLSVEELESLHLPLKFQGDLVIIDTSLRECKLKQPLAIELSRILAAKEKGLVDYIIRSCINDQASLIPYIFENESLQKLARHFLRHLSGSHKSCLVYSANVRKYATWLGHKPDFIILDAKQNVAFPDPQKFKITADS